jgi:hypothetical protein
MVSLTTLTCLIAATISLVLLAIVTKRPATPGIAPATATTSSAVTVEAAPPTLLLSSLGTAVWGGLRLLIGGWVGWLIGGFRWLGLLLVAHDGKVVRLRAVRLLARK